MREHKFRAMSCGEKIWVYSTDNGLHDFFYGIDDGQLNSATLEEYIGKKDKNRKEIYEGNKVKLKSHMRENSEKFILGIVQFKNAEFMVKQTTKEKDYYSDRKNDLFNLKFYWEEGSWFNWEDLEIIGDIYEDKSIEELEE